MHRTNLQNIKLLSNPKIQNFLTFANMQKIKFFNCILYACLVDGAMQKALAQDIT